MTGTGFLTLYPQFSAIPSAVLADAEADAAGRFGDLPEDTAERARGLYMAHTLTLWARAALPEGAEPAVLWSVGDGQLTASQSLNGNTVSRHEPAAYGSLTGGFSEWRLTVYGQRLIPLVLASGGGTVYVP